MSRRAPCEVESKVCGGKLPLSRTRPGLLEGFSLSILGKGAPGFGLDVLEEALRKGKVDTLERCSFVLGDAILELACDDMYPIGEAMR